MKIHKVVIFLVLKWSPKEYGGSGMALGDICVASLSSLSLSIVCGFHLMLVALQLQSGSFSSNIVTVP